jgi:hypothetical protein
MKNPNLSSSSMRFLVMLGQLLVLTSRLFAEPVQLPYSLLPGTSYVGIPLLRPALFTGKITKTDPATFRVQVNSFPPIDFATVPGWGTSPCFLEISASPGDASLEGERYEVDPVRTLKENGFVVLKSASSNTRNDLPSALAGATFSIHPHWTLATVFGDAGTTKLGKGRTASSSDEIKVYSPDEKSGYRSFFVQAGDLKTPGGWRSALSSQNSDPANTVIPPGYGLILVRKTSEVFNFAIQGEPRTHAFRFPLRAGSNLLAPGHLKNFSLQKLAASSANGFVAGSTPLTSDQVRILVGERLETFAYLSVTPARWVCLESRYSLPEAEVVIAPVTKALEIRKVKADPDFVIPYIP